MNDAAPPVSDEDARQAALGTERLLAQLGEVVLGQDDALRDVLIGLLADGHVLLEGVPGVAKTLLARALSASLGLVYRRVQFTPDLMPTDLLGTRVWDAERREWELSRGLILIYVFFW